MLPLAAAEVRAGEIRIRLAELAAETELTDETRAELDTLRHEYTDTERRMAALRISEPERTPIVSKTSEGNEYRAMLERANVGNVYDALINRRAVDGVEAELQQHLGLGGNQIPLDLLRGAGNGGRGNGGLETRAVTPGATNVGQTEMPVVPNVFPQSAAAFLGVDMPTVGVGEAVYPVLTATLSVEALAENAAGTETTGAFSSDVLVPSRLQASFFYSREDRARMSMLDSALRQNLSDGLADGLDARIISGDPVGLLHGTVLPNNNVTSADSYDTYISNLMYGQIDGRYASMASALRLVVGSGTYADMGATYRNNSVDRSALDRLMEMTGGVMVSAHVPAVDSNNRQNAVIMRGMSMTAVAPVWEGVTIIPDEITKAANGQIVITAVMLYAVKVLRTAAGLVKQQTQHS